MPKSSTTPLVILGIDPGLADTGFGVVHQSGNKLKMVDYGSIKTKAGLPLEKRLLEIHESLVTLIKAHRPSAISIEKLFFCKNLKTAIDVGQARGVVLLTAGQYQLQISEFTPLEIKLALTSYGKASKNQIKQMVKNILQLEKLPKSDDAADALASAICCAHSLTKIK
ncbi:MAG: crossover junction endodeoxyribonuclease RuvC [Candidatus Buchananbacteria bacterium]|nr:crossover junction endodeoxyribonuclease RuvC [Candidatus Buchananbacteria bacterium]